MDTPENPEIATSKLSETRRMQFAIIIWITFVVFITFVSLRPVQLPGDTLGIIIGGLLTFVGIVISYYFSTSMGSTVKSQMMSKMGIVGTPTVSVTPQPDATTITTTKTEPK